jgi:aspartyl-tRNA synthetase
MALGVERLASTLLGLPHIRMAMAFPKTTGGQCLLTEALS